MKTTKAQESQKLSLAGLLISLGIIFGDIGTSPLYVVKAIFNKGVIEETLILGSLSCVFWTLTLQTTIKYVWITLNADNKGEGGILSLYSLVRKKAKWLIIPAIIGGSTLLADGMITPAITISSAIEGLVINHPGIPTVPICCYNYQFTISYSTIRNISSGAYFRTDDVYLVFDDRCFRLSIYETST